MNRLIRWIVLLTTAGLAACVVGGGDPKPEERNFDIPVTVKPQTCQDGDCVQTTNEFAAGSACYPEGSRRCAADIDGYQVCLQDADSGVLGWSLQTLCGTDLSCVAGHCIDGHCEDECNLGGRRCAPGGFQECGDTDPDECLEWAPAETCPQGTVCVSGECLPGTVCQDQCVGGARECAGSVVYRVCGNYDEDDCTEWSDFVSCEGNQTCSGGQCLWTCEDECQPGDQRCSPEENAYQLCDDHDLDPCFEWSYPWPCFGGQTCSEGECRDECVDECIAGHKACGTNASVLVCGQFDFDPCTDWSSPAPCAGGKICVFGACEPLPAASLQFVSPGTTCKKTTTLSVDVTGPIAEVAYYGDGLHIATSNESWNDFSVIHVFTWSGQWELSAVGYDQQGNVLAETYRTVVVEGETALGIPEVPYFNQNANVLSPSDTSQNTSIAMVLAWLGWEGQPDDITEVWGKYNAQTPAGLAEVFNWYAQQMAIEPRLHPHTDGTLAGFRALLDQGKPVIVHGNFTDSGHVVVALAYTDDEYIVNDPAGTWDGFYKGSHAGTGDPDSGDHAHYDATAFEAAVATSDGMESMPLWYYEVK